ATSEALEVVLLFLTPPWQLIHEKGYAPKATTVSVRGDLANIQGRLQLNVSGTNETLALAADPKNANAYGEAQKKLGQTLIVQGVMVPTKDLKARVPLQVGQVK